ncbi:MAG TPA: immunoglobulin domain-containing protein, partial [Verrucomicrobiae bacterium]
SCAAPLWAGFSALINQQAAINGQSPVGFINPAIYELASESSYNTVFHDVTTGNNTSSSSPGAFYAVSGYDLCTGLGTPNGTNFINALLKPDALSVATNYGFTAISSSGTPNISSQTFYVTNTGASSLTWSLINTSAWLNASSSGNTLSPGAGNSVVVSLTGITSLSAGTYTATLWFSNVTSGIGHARLFTLKVIDPLVIGPTNVFNFNGPAGGPFSPATQQITLTNTGTASLNWSLGNTSTWFNVTPASGALSAGAHTTLTFTTTSAATNVPAGIYNVLFNVTNKTSGVLHAINGNLLVGQSLVFNGGFETDDFTGWTLAGDGDTTNYVDNSASFITPHSGLCVALLGQPVTMAYLSQNLPTISGQKYLLSLWLYNPLRGSGSNPNQFSVSWNGTTLYNKTNIPLLSWTNMQFIVTATTSSTVLLIGGREDNYFLGLDDVSVTPGFAPTIAVQPTNQFVLVGSNAVLSAAVNGSTPLVYQWLRNGTNLVDGPGVVGTATNILTLNAVTMNSAGNYSFTVTNIFGAVTSSVATLTIVLPPKINTVTANPGGGVTLSLAGSPGVNYVLESSTNLLPAASWQPVATNLMATNGVWLFNDSQVTSVPQRFYRLKYSK